MHRALKARAAAVAGIAALVLSATACQSNESIDSLVGASPSPSLPVFPATVDGGGTPMSEAGCQQYAGQDPLPLQCQPVPEAQAYLLLTEGSTTYGKAEYVPVEQFKASCTKEAITLTGPDELSLTFTPDSRTVLVMRGDTRVGTYQDPFLWWITHTSVATNGTNKVADATLSVSVRLTCQLPEPTKDPIPSQPAQTPEPATSAGADEPV